MKIPENGKKVAGREGRVPEAEVLLPAMHHPDVDVGRLPLSPPKQLRPVIGQQLWPLSNRLRAAPREPQATRTTKAWVRTVPSTCAWMDPRLIFSLPPDPKVDNVGSSPNVDIIWSLAKLVRLAPEIQRASH